MRYLFFDTEASNCFNNVRKMCELGYLLTDEAFRIQPGTKTDILMNPGKDGRFNLSNRKGGRDITLAHSEEEYKKANLFRKHYDNIRFLLEQKDIQIFLWSAESDTQAILDQCTRYHLPEIAFVSYDVQAIFKKVFLETKKTPRLETAMDTLGISRANITSHRPDDDALMTMLVLKGLCEKTGKTIEEIIDDCPNCKMESISFYANHKVKMEQKRLAQIRAKELAPFKAELNELYAQKIPEVVPNEKVFDISMELLKHLDETLGAIKTWTKRGFFLKRSLEVPYLVYYDEADRARFEARPDLTKAKLVSIDEFDAMTQGK